MATIPKKLKIGGEVWRLRVAKMLYKSPHVLGYCDPDRKVIALKKDLDGAELLATFLHELIHAAWPEGVVSETTEEKILEAIDLKIAEALISSKLIDPKKIKLPKK